MIEKSITKKISDSVLIERINRRLELNSQNRKESRMNESPSFGHFYAQSESGSERSGSIDIESIGRELGVIIPGESPTE
jgi:hypothetical protein